MRLAIIRRSSEVEEFNLNLPLILFLLFYTKFLSQRNIHSIYRERKFGQNRKLKKKKDTESRREAADYWLHAALVLQVDVLASNPSW